VGVFTALPLERGLHPGIGVCVGLTRRLPIELNNPKACQRLAALDESTRLSSAREAG